MASPLVSIVISNYNYADYVSEAIESALNQTYRNLEVIVVDDGSTDGSREVIERFRRDVRVIYKENGGQASALNAGFAVSRGGLVVFLDADDRLDPDAVEVVVAHWSPGVAKVQWRLRAVDGSGRPLAEVFPQEEAMPSGDVSRYLLTWLHYPSPPTSGNAFSRDVLGLIMPIPESDWAISADRYLITRASLIGPIISIDRILGCYRIHGKNNWFADEVAVDRLLRQVQVAQRQRDLVEAAARERGLAVRSAGLPWALKAQMGLAALAPAALRRLGLPASRLEVALRGIRSTLSFPFFPSGLARWRLAAWFALMGVVPRPVARRLATWGLAPARRPGWLRALLRWGGAWRRGGLDAGG